nr:DUF805 domain-containing protein [Sphingomonas mali]
MAGVHSRETIANRRRSMEWMLMPLKRYADFQGRSRRMEFWMWILFTLIVGLVLGFIDGILGFRLGPSSSSSFSSGGVTGFSTFSSIGILGLLWSLATLVPNIAVAMRRLHDTDRTGWWLLLPVIPYVIGLVIMLGAAAGQNLGLIAVGGIFSLIGLVGAIVLLVFYCLPGTPGPNRFGPDPLGSTGDLAQTFR